MFGAVKEALWHADTGGVRAKELYLHEIQAGTGISCPCNVWYLTRGLCLLRWKSSFHQIRESPRQAFSRAGRTK
jgi:hypothetical protein